MVIGHCALAFGAKRFAPGVSLGTLLLAAVLADLLWPLLVLVGAESFQIRIDATAVMPLEFINYPYSHSLIALTFAAVVFCAVRAIVGRTTGQALLVVGTLVISHWVLDVVAHGPDLPLSPAGDGRFGLGLWNSMPATLLVEGVLLAGGVFLYATMTTPQNRAGSLGLWALVAVLVAAFAALMFGPVPQSHGVVLAAAGSLWIVVLWGYWVDRNRVSSQRRDTRAPSPSASAASARPHVRRKRAPSRAGGRSRI